MKQRVLRFIPEQQLSQVATVQEKRRSLKQYMSDSEGHRLKGQMQTFLKRVSFGGA
jgi:hypothetical protein